MAAKDFDCDVLIVGLGPVGATLTSLLAQYGIKTIAIERDASVYPLPRAAHFDHEVMRVFQELGIAGEVERHTRPRGSYEFRAADQSVLARFNSDKPSISGWEAGYMFHQPGVEYALRDLIAHSALAEMRIGWRFVSLDQDAGGVNATVESPAGNRTLRAKYLVGCDGASSRVRQSIDSKLDDYGFDEPWLVLDVKLEQESRVPQVSLQICDPAGPTSCVLMGPGRHRWEFMLLPGQTQEEVLRDEYILNKLAAWDCGPLEVERKAVYHFHALVADAWRAKRVLLAGDSAHQTPPFAGQGMCSGIRDAANLAWKLSAVLNSQAPEALLDTYQTEREPHVRALIELAMSLGRVVCTLDHAAAAQRDQHMRANPNALADGAALPSLGAGCLMRGNPLAGTLFPQPVASVAGKKLWLDDVLGKGPWLISQAPHPVKEGDLKVISLDSPELAPFRASLLAWLEANKADAVLVRPDRYVFGIGSPASLLDAWRAALHTTIQ